MKLKPSGGTRGTQRNLEMTLNLGLKSPRVQKPKLKPDLKPQLHVDPVNPGLPILPEILPATGTQQNQTLSVHLRPNLRRILPSLVKRLHIHSGKTPVAVISPRLQPIVVYPETLIRVTNRETQREVVTEVIAPRLEIESGQISFRDLEAHDVRSEYEPEDQGHDSEANGYADEDVADDAQDATAAAAEAV